MGGIWKNRRKTIFGLILPGLAFIVLHSFGLGQDSRPEVVEKRYKPELMIQTGSVSLVNTVAVAPDGKTAASSGGDNIIRLFDIETGWQSKSMVDEGWVLSIAFSPDGKILASSGFDTIRLWDVKTGALIKKLEGHAGLVFSVAFSPDGKTLASGSADKTARLWNLESGSYRSLEGHASFVFSVAFSPTENILATGGTDGRIMLWETTAGNLLKKLEGHTNEVWSVSFAPGGKLLASSGKDRTVRLWNLESGAVRVIEGQPASIYSIVFSRDAKTLAIGGDNSINLWDVEKAVQLKSLTGHTSFIRAVTYTKDGEKLISGSSDNSVKIWDVETGKPTVSIENHTSHILAVAFSPDEKFLASVGFNNRINLWNLETGKQVRALEYRTENPTVKEINTIAFSPDGSLLAGDDREHAIRLWNVATGKVVKSFKGHTSQIHSVAFSPDGKMLASGSEDNTVIIWNAETGRPVKTLAGHEKGVTTVAFSPDGKILASGGRDNAIKLWDVATKMLRRSLTGHRDEISAVKFAPDGKTLASASFDKTVKLWNPVTGQEKTTLAGHADKVNSISYSKDGDTLVSADKSGGLHRWNLTTGKSGSVRAHPKEISAVAFAPQKDIFVSGSWDGTMKLWREDHDEPLATLFSLDETDWAVITPDSRYDVSQNAEKLLYFIVSDPESGPEIIDLEQLRQNFRPHLLKKLFTGRIVPPNKDFSVTKFPEVEIEPSEQKAARLRLKLVNRGGGIGRVEVRLNGSEVTANATQENFAGTTSPFVDLTIEIPGEKLQTGTNKGEIVTWNSEGNVRSKRREFYLEKNDGGVFWRGVEPVKLAKDKAKPFEGKFYAIVAGISEYANPDLNLGFAAKDAEDMTQTLALGARKLLCGKEIEAKKPCDRVHLRLLTTEKDVQAQFAPADDVKQNFKRFEPTKRNFSSVFTEIAKLARPEDIVVIYLAGHATQVTNIEALNESGFSDTYLYATSDADTLSESELGNKSKRETTTVSSLELADWVNEFKGGITAKKKAIILDTCAAGAVQEDLTKSRSDGDNDEQIRALVRLNERAGFYVLMGSAADAVSYEASDYRQGLLTYALIEAIDIDGALEDGKLLNIEKWFYSVGDRVEDLAKGLGGIQSPRFYKENVGKLAAQPFVIGQFGPQEKQNIPRASSVPMLLQPEFNRKSVKTKYTDDLRLRDKLETRLRELSRELKRGEPAAFNYVNAKKALNGWSLRGEYVTLNGLVRVDGALVRDEKTSIPFKAQGGENEIVEKIVAEIRRIVTGINSKP